MQLTTPFSIHLSAALETRPKIFSGDSHLNSYLRFDEATEVFLFKNRLPSRSPFDDINTAPTSHTLFLQT